MAVWERQTVTKTWVEYVLPNPTNWAEFDKAAAAARRDLEKAGRPIGDDTVEVIGRDDEIVLRFEIFEASGGGS